MSLLAWRTWLARLEESARTLSFMVVTLPVATLASAVLPCRLHYNIPSTSSRGWHIVYTVRKVRYLGVTSCSAVRGMAWQYYYIVYVSTCVVCSLVQKNNRDLVLLSVDKFTYISSVRELE